MKKLCDSTLSTATHTERADLNSFFRTGDMLVTEVLQRDEPRHGVVKPRPHADRLTRTAARVEVTPHLHAHD